jgi:hypothetical protein
MGNKAAPSAAAIYTPAQIALDARQSRAEDLAARDMPETYQFDPFQANKTAALLSRAKTLSDREALRELYPEVFAGQDQAIKEIAGGEAADNQFLRNEALKAGLEKAIGTGAQVGGAGSAGTVTAANAFGRNLLDYRDRRRQQQLALAEGLQPDSAVDPSDALAAIEGSKQGGIQTRNDWKTFLNNMRFNSIQGANNRLGATTAAEQSRLNANAASANAGTGQLIGAGASLAAAGIGAGAIIL